MEAGAPVRRNLWAYIGLWLVLSSWLLLIVRLVSGELGAIDGFFDWLYLLVIAAAMIVATAGVAAIRKRGEPLLAVAVLAFSFLLPGIYVLFFLLIGWAFSGGGIVAD